MANRETEYATELARGSIAFNKQEEARIERLYIKGQKLEEIRFSWWKEGRLMMRPLDLTEDSLLALLRDAAANGVFTFKFMADLQKLPGDFLESKS
jgi:hypothetical protein